MTSLFIAITPTMFFLGLAFIVMLTSLILYHFKFMESRGFSILLRGSFISMLCWVLGVNIINYTAEKNSCYEIDQSIFFNKYLKRYRDKLKMNKSAIENVVNLTSSRKKEIKNEIIFLEKYLIYINKQDDFIIKIEDSSYSGVIFQPKEYFPDYGIKDSLVNIYGWIYLLENKAVKRKVSCPSNYKYIK